MTTPVKICLSCGHSYPDTADYYPTHGNRCKACKRWVDHRYYCKRNGLPLDKQLEVVEEHPDLWSNSPCKSCKARAICVVEIRRATYWPPCMPASRHYDIEIARTAQRWGWERGKARRVAA
jgi:hypothetical protein